MLSSTTPWKYGVFCIPNVIWISCFMTNLSSGNPDGNLPVRFFRRGTSCTAPASCSDPRRASGLLGAERCGPRPLPEQRCLSSGIPDRVDGVAGTSCSPVSTSHCILLPLPTGSPPGAGSCAPRSIFVLLARGLDTPDACRGPSVCMACPSPSLPITKAPEVFPSRLPSSYLADSTIS